MRIFGVIFVFSSHVSLTILLSASPDVNNSRHLNDFFSSCPGLQARVPSTGQVSGEGPDESSGDEELKARKESSGFAREVLGQPSEDDEHNEIARDELEEGSGLGDDGTSEGFVAYKSVKLKQQQ